VCRGIKYRIHQNLGVLLCGHIHFIIFVSIKLALAFPMDGFSFPNRVRRSSLELANSNPTIYFRGLPAAINENALVDILCKFGEVKKVAIFNGAEVGVNDASAMLSSAEQARNCVSSLNGAPTSTGILEVFSRIGVESKFHLNFTFTRRHIISTQLIFSRN